jgi:AcrR family transcriptional regulator
MPTARTTTDGRRIKGEERRKIIIEAAIDCIATRGLSNTTLDAVAERAKVSRALVVFHFKSKNLMYVDVLNFLGTRYSAGYHAILADESSSASERLFGMLEYIVRFARDFPQYLSVWHSFWGEAIGSTLYREVSLPRDLQYFVNQRALLQALVEEGGYDAVDVTAVNKGIRAMLFGLWWDSHLSPGPDQYPDAMRALRTYLSKLFPRHFIAD